MGFSRRVAIGAGIAAAAVVAVVIASAGDGDDGPTDPRADAPVVDEPFAFGEPAPAYEVRYRLEDLSDRAVPLSTDHLVVRRPRWSRLDTLDGPPPGGDLQSRQVSDGDVLQIGSRSEPAVVARVSGPAVSDVRLDVVLDEARRRGLVEAREVRRVLDRLCRVHRSGSLLGAGQLGEIGPDQYVDTCVDATGIMLEEVLVLDGRPTLRRIAVAVDDTADPAAEVFATEPITAGVTEGGGSTRPVDADTGALGEFWELGSAVLADFDSLGRRSVIPPQPDRFADPLLRDTVVAGTTDTFVRGTELVVIYQGGSLGGQLPFPVDAGARQVDVGELGEAEVHVTSTTLEVRAARPGGRFVHVIGTTSLDRLVRVARALVPTEGSGLVYLDE